MDLERFYVRDGKICLWNYKLTERVHSLRYLDEPEKDSYRDVGRYFDAVEEMESYKTDYISKHKLLEVAATEEYDNSEYEWMAGYKLRTDDPHTEIPLIYSYGSIEAYEASLEESADAYMTDLDYRLSMLELGLTE